MADRERPEESPSLQALAAADSMSAEQMWQALHEMRVHQIELEIQNEELRVTQAALDAARARYFDLYELAPVGYCTVAESGLLQEANLTASNMLAARRDAVVGQPMSRFIDKRDQDIYYLMQRGLFANAGPRECELRLIGPSGEPFWAHLTATAFTGDDGATAMRMVLADISERRRAEQKTEYAASVFSHSREAIMITEADGTIMDVNEAFTRITGYAREEVIGRNPNVRERSSSSYPSFPIYPC
ncbi:MAG: PAS domain S-box protein [Gammaproteobacteria bacterium]|nr:PAS domain S-box protein [Gammaproteobacteria bacterium]